MKGNRPVNNTNPMADVLKAQQAAYFAAGGVLQVVPIGQGSYANRERLSEKENRLSITKSMGVFFA